MLISCSGCLHVGITQQVSHVDTMQWVSSSCWCHGFLTSLSGLHSCYWEALTVRWRLLGLTSGLSLVNAHSTSLLWQPKISEYIAPEGQMAPVKKKNHMSRWHFNSTQPKRSLVWEVLFWTLRSWNQQLVYCCERPDHVFVRRNMDFGSLG